MAAVPVDPWPATGGQQANDGDLDPLHEEFGPLFGLDPYYDSQLVQELDSQPVQQIAQQQVEDMPRPVSEGKRPASATPEGQPPSARRRLDTSASDRWDAHRAGLGSWTPAWEGLTDQQRLLLQAAASSVPPRGSPLEDAQARLQAHRDAQFLRVATSVAKVTKRFNADTAPLQARITKLGEGSHREFMQERLNRACETFPGTKPETVRKGTALRDIYTCLGILEALKTKADAQNITIEDCLKAILKQPLARLPEKQRTMPDGDASRRCMEELGKELGNTNTATHSSRELKELIKLLIGVDLLSSTAEIAAPAAPSSDNPIPKTRIGKILHGHFESLTVEANRKAFAGFFEMRNSYEKTKDWEGMTAYARPVEVTILFLQKLEKEKDADGEPYGDVETELKKVFGRALEPEKTPVTDWGKWRTVTLTKPQLAALRRELKALPGIEKE